MARAQGSPTGANASAPCCAHAETCEACAVLLEAEGELASALDGYQPELPAGAADAVLAAVAADTGLRATLRRAPTSVQVMWAVVLLLTAVGGVALQGIRPDIGSYPALRMGGVLVVLVASTAAALAVTLRPLHRPPLQPLAITGAAVAALGMPILLAVVPEAVTGHMASMSKGAFWSTAAGCFLMGTGAGVLLFVLLRAMDRRSRTPAALIVLSAALIGLAGNVALQLHCPLTAPMHLLAGHASVGVVWAAIAGVAVIARGR